MFVSPPPQSAPHRQPSGPVAAPRQCLWPRRTQLAAVGPSANISPTGGQCQYGDSVTLSMDWKLYIQQHDLLLWVVGCQWPYPYAIKQLPDEFLMKSQCKKPTKQNRQWSEAAENTNVICHEGEVDTVDSSVCCGDQSEVKLNLYLLNTRYNVQTFAADHLTLLLQKVTILFIFMSFSFCALVNTKCSGWLRLEMCFASLPPSG